MCMGISIVDFLNGSLPRKNFVVTSFDDRTLSTMVEILGYPDWMDPTEWVMDITQDIANELSDRIQLLRSIRSSNDILDS